MRVIVVGAGEVGFHTAGRLAEEGHPPSQYALGDMYYHKPISYPYSFDGIISDEYLVATFLLDGSVEGFDMYLNCNKLLPSSLYMCNNVMTFKSLIIGQPK